MRDIGLWIFQSRIPRIQFFTFWPNPHQPHQTHSQNFISAPTHFKPHPILYQSLLDLDDMCCHLHTSPPFAQITITTTLNNPSHTACLHQPLKLHHPSPNMHITLHPIKLATTKSWGWGGEPPRWRLCSYQFSPSPQPPPPLLTFMPSHLINSCVTLDLGCHMESINNMVLAVEGRCLSRCENHPSHLAPPLTQQGPNHTCPIRHWPYALRGLLNWADHALVGGMPYCEAICITHSPPLQQILSAVVKHLSARVGTLVLTFRLDLGQWGWWM